MLKNNLGTASRIPDGKPAVSETTEPTAEAEFAWPKRTELDLDVHTTEPQQCACDLDVNHLCDKHAAEKSAYEFRNEVYEHSLLGWQIEGIGKASCEVCDAPAHWHGERSGNYRCDVHAYPSAPEPKPAAEPPAAVGPVKVLEPSAYARAVELAGELSGEDAEAYQAGLSKLADLIRAVDSIPTIQQNANDNYAASEARLHEQEALTKELQVRLDSASRVAAMETPLVEAGMKAENQSASSKRIADLERQLNAATKTYNTNLQTLKWNHEQERKEWLNDLRKRREPAAVGDGELPKIEITDEDRNKLIDFGSGLVLHPRLANVSGAVFNCRERQLKEARTALRESVARERELRQLATFKEPCGHESLWQIAGEGGNFYCLLCANDKANADLTTLRTQLETVTRDRDAYKSRLGPLATGALSGFSGAGITYVIGAEGDGKKIAEAVHALSIESELRALIRAERERVAELEAQLKAKEAQ